MAAPPAKPSPSNQAVQELATTEQQPQPSLKDPPPSSVAVDAPPAAAATAAASTTTSLQQQPPTYESSETSEHYKLAKDLLNAGEFEEALSLIEEQIETTKAVLADFVAGVPNNNDEKDDNMELHESLAPLHYLYGTTLLYSLEEAKEDLGASEGADAATGGGADAPAQDVHNNLTVAGSMAERAVAAAQAAQDMANGGSGGAAAAPGSGGPNPWAHLSGQDDEKASAVAAAAAPDTSAALPDDAVDDMMIAWENLEAARAILERILASASTTNSVDTNKYRLDLAQTLLRVADLQRLNGRNEEAIQDYTSCLELRQAVLVDDPWNRKIADAQYNLGLTYLTSSTMLQKVDNGDAASSDPSKSSGAAPVALAKEHCRKGVDMYVACAKTFAGILAELCGADPETVVGEVTEAEMEAAAAAFKNAAQPPTGGLKTTGLFEDDDDKNVEKGSATINDNKSLSDQDSRTLSVYRMRVANLLKTQAPSDDEDAASRAYDLQELLDEIQETVDEAERSQEGVKQVSEIKARAQAAAAAAAGSESGFGEEVTEADGVTTSIGFGASAAGTAAATASSTVTAATGTSIAQPMMVVKKKKKRAKDDAEGGQEDAKPAAVDAKRAKTTEE